MKGPKGIKTLLDELGATLDRVDTKKAVPTLRNALAAKSAAIVAQGADLAGKLKATDLVGDLCTAFGSFMGAGLATDKHCLAKTAIVKALHQLQSHQPAVFLDGMTCYWPYQPRPGQRDEATPLRIAATIAYAELASRSELDLLVDRLVDPVSDVRQVAVRGLVALGGPTAAMVLRLKVLLGDENPSVMDECFSGLLNCDSGRYLPFVAGFMHAGDDRVRVGAAIALGESGHENAFDLLLACWTASKDQEFRRDLLVAMALLRKDRAWQCLVGLIASGGEDARAALDALATYRTDPQLRRQIEAALAQAGEPELQRVFDKKFGKGL